MPVCDRAQLRGCDIFPSLAKRRLNGEIDDMAGKSESGSDSKYAGRSAATGRYVLKPAVTGTSYRSAGSGRFVTEAHGKTSPRTTVHENGKTPEKK